MACDWYFKPIDKGTTFRESIVDAFFSSDAISEPGTALVREGIQNALDATIKGEQTIVRISLLKGNSALSRQDMEFWLAKAQAHYQASDNGLRAENRPSGNEECAALIFEDFSTYGLQGDPANPYPPASDEENDFFHFFRAEGRTDKTSDKRGSWGLGKDVFFRASRLHTIFGLTIRKDDSRCLLMGKTVLKSHRLASGDDWYQEGYFGIQCSTDGLVLPTESSAVIEKFCDTFRLERKTTGESGLSIVVPWPNPEITRDEIIRAIFQNYFFTILRRELCVFVELADEEEFIIDHDTLVNEARKLSKHLADKYLANVLPVIELAEWAVGSKPAINEHILKMPETGRRWLWSKDLFSDELLQRLKEKWQGQERIAIRVPVTVRRINSEWQESHFDVYMEPDGTNESRQPVFIRNGLVICDAKSMYVYGAHALVVIEDRPLSAFLHQAENPSHTVWQAQLLKQDYISGVGDLQFILASANRIAGLIMAADKEEDRRLLADLFPLPGKGARKHNRTLPPLPRRPVTISGIDGGFRLTKGKEQIEPGCKARILIAYDTRQGKALYAYKSTDFRLGMTPFRHEHQGVEILSLVDNKIIIRIIDPDHFHVTVTGFDQNRQIYVWADIVEDSDATATD